MEPAHFLATSAVSNPLRLPQRSRGRGERAAAPRLPPYKALSSLRSSRSLTLLGEVDWVPMHHGSGCPVKQERPS